MRRLPIQLCLSILPLLASPAAAEWASGVPFFSGGPEDLGSVDLISNDPCRGMGRALDMDDALGPPDDSFVSIGEEGTIVLEFKHDIVDGSGPDVRVYVSCNAGVENASVWVSPDGVNFTIPLGSITEYPYVDFDLSGSGLASTPYLMIVDDPGTLFPDFGLAIDVDAAATLHDPVATEQITWGAIKSLYR